MSKILIYKNYCDYISNKQLDKIIKILKYNHNNSYESELCSNILEFNFYEFILENEKLFHSLLKLLYHPFKFSYNQLKNLHDNNELTKNIFNDCSIKISNIKNIFVKLYIFNYFECHTKQKIKIDFPKLHCIKSRKKLKINEQVEQVERVKQVKKNKSCKKIRSIKKIQNSEEDDEILK